MNIKRRRKRIPLFLYNDEFNSFESIVLSLTRHVPKCNTLRAEQLSLLAHNNGKTQIYSGFSPEVYQIQANLIKCGLIIETK